MKRLQRLQSCVLSQWVLRPSDGWPDHHRSDWPFAPSPVLRSRRYWSVIQASHSWLQPGSWVPKENGPRTLGPCRFSGSALLLAAAFRHEAHRTQAGQHQRIRLGLRDRRRGTDEEERLGAVTGVGELRRELHLVVRIETGEVE